MLNKVKKVLTDEKGQKTVFTVAVVIIILLSLLLIISRIFGTFSFVSVAKNNKTIFSISDLTVNDLKFSDTQKEVETQMGKPNKEKTITENHFKYKKLYYDGITFTLKEHYDDYILTKVEITSRRYTINRNINVGDRILRVIKKFKVDNRVGTYLYGNNIVEALDDSEIKDEIYLGVRSNSDLVYVYKDAKVGNTEPNIARLNITYGRGKVTKIVWSYDYK